MSQTAGVLVGICEVMTLVTSAFFTTWVENVKNVDMWKKKSRVKIY